MQGGGGGPGRSAPRRQTAGDPEATFEFSRGFLCNVLRNMTCGSRMKVCAYFVDCANVDAAKAAAAASRKVKYVSTNDVCTAAYANFVGPRVLEMAINFRGRLTGVNEADAGNYEGTVVYAAPQDYATPEAIRMSLTGTGTGGIRRAGHLADPTRRESALPGGCGRAFSRLALITNWATFALDLDWGEGCGQVLHLPLMRGVIETGVLFRPRPQQLALLLFTRRKALPDFGPDSPFGAVMNPDMFA